MLQLTAHIAGPTEAFLISAEECGPVQYTHLPKPGNGPRRTVQLDGDPHAWARVAALAERFDVWSWQERYERHGAVRVFGGVGELPAWGWSLQLAGPGRQVSASGAGCAPPGFHELRRALERLAGGRAFS